VFYHREENTVPTALKNFEYEAFCYVKVFGSIRMFKEQRAIVGTHIARISDFDEVTNHFLQIFVSHCVRRKGVLKEKDLQRNDSNQGQPKNKTEFKSFVIEQMKNISRLN